MIKKYYWLFYWLVFFLFFLECRFAYPLRAEGVYFDGGGDLLQYVGKSVHSLEVQKWLNKLGEKNEIISGKAIYYYPEKGIAIALHDGNMIDRIYLFGQLIKKENVIIKPYKGAINDRFTLQNTRKEVFSSMIMFKQVKDDFDLLVYGEAQGVLTLIYFDKKDLNAKINRIVFKYDPCLKGDCKNGYGVFADLDGLKYEGNWVNGKYHGDGKMTLVNGSIREGIWENGIFKGKNFFKSNGLYDLLGKNQEHDKFKEFSKSQKSDYRKISLAYDYANMVFGDSKVMLFFNDKGNIYKFRLNKSSLSDFSKGSFNDKMSITSDQNYVQYLMGTPAKKEESLGTDFWYYNNDKYNIKIEFNASKTIENIEVKLDNSVALVEGGSCLNGECYNGFGEYRTNSGRYTGTFVNGKFDGNGAFYYNNKSTYLGQFKANQREGKGKLIMEETIYEGEWHNNEPHGFGTMIYADKSKYVGSWENGQRHGKGTLYFANGERFDGDWEDDLQNGQGKLYFDKNKKKTGFWKNGILLK